MAATDFLSEFPPVSTEAWEQAIRAALKGADYGEKLVWNAQDGLSIKPYYRAADLDGIAWLPCAPGEFPYVRGTSAHGGWRIREEIEPADAEEANRAACAAIAAGAEEIAFTRALPASAAEIAVLLANLNEIPVHFANMNVPSLRLLIERQQRRPHAAGLSAAFDPLSDPAFAWEALSAAPPGMTPFRVDAGEFHRRGATCAEEIGFALAAAVDFMAAMQERGAATDRIAGSLAFSFAMGPEFFLEIAKLRAFRLVWAQAVESFGGSRQHARARIHARTVCREAATGDEHWNILRGATEAMAAVMGGADSISIMPFDACYRAPDESSRRLARNTQIVLKLEAHLARVADPGGGSYFLEALTRQLACQAWKLMQKAEAAGGFCKASQAGILKVAAEMPPLQPAQETGN